MKIIRQGKIVTIRVNEKEACPLADVLMEKGVEVTEVRLQHQTAIGIIITAPTDNVESLIERIESVCVWYFTNQAIKKSIFSR